MSRQAAGRWHCRAPGPPGEAAAAGGFCSLQNLHQREGASRAVQFSGARRKWLGPWRGYCHLGGQGPLLENISPRALLGETYVTDNYNSSGVPGTGSALPLQTPGPRASRAEGQHLQPMAAPLPLPGPGDAGAGTHKGRILHHSPPLSLVGATASSMGEGERETRGWSCCRPRSSEPCQPVRGDTTPRPHPLGWRSSSPPASGSVVASRGDK